MATISAGSCELTLEQALAETCARLTPIDSLQQIAAPVAGGRILARALVSPVDLPAFDNAAMDGYALRSSDLGSGRTRLRVVGRALAGHVFGGVVGAGQCVRTMTGAPMPEGTDTVAMQEKVERLGDDEIGIDGPLAAGENRRRRGEHVRAGDTLLPAGRMLRGADAALAVAVGIEQLLVTRRLRIGVLSTGDELADPPAPLPATGAYDANRPLLLSALERMPVVSFDLGICADDAGAFERMIDRAVELSLDVLLTSGGSALGEADVVRMHGAAEFLPVNFGPGRGLVLARLQRRARTLTLLGLPGNAVAAYVMFHLLARPALLHLAGARAGPPLHVDVPLATGLSVKPGRLDYRRARLVRGTQGRLAVELLREQGAAMLRTVSDADALAAIGPQAEYRAGDPVPVVAIDMIDR